MSSNTENKKPKNPPAFPAETSVEFQRIQGSTFLGVETPDTFRVIRQIEGGMTLRDYFAAKAMEAIVSVGATSESWNMSYYQIASYAYLQADAMLAERSKA